MNLGCGYFTLRQHDCDSVREASVIRVVGGEGRVGRWPLVAVCVDAEAELKSIQIGFSGTIVAI
jgi:hypothetical protein